MNKNALKGAGVLLSLCLVFGAVGCQKSDDKAKTKENQSVSSEEAGMEARKIHLSRRTIHCQSRMNMYMNF